MKATARDVRNALTARNCLILAGIAVVSAVLIWALGYVVWQRFPVSGLIILTSIFGWSIARMIGDPWLSEKVNAASVGFSLFGVSLVLSAVIDAMFFPRAGYVTWAVITHLAMWGTWKVYTAWKRLRSMPPDRRIHVTEGTGMIIAEMTYREARIAEVIERYDEAKGKMQFAVP